MRAIRRGGGEPPPPPDPQFTFSRWHDGRFICEPSTGGFVLTGPDGCSCPQWHARCQDDGEARCEHQTALGLKLLAEGAKLIRLGLELTNGGADVPEVKAGPIRCPRCASRCFEYPNAIRCQQEACGYWRILP